MRNIKTNSFPIVLLLGMTLLISCHFSSEEESSGPEKSSTDPIDLSPLGLVSPRSPLLLSSDFGETWEDVSQGLPREAQVSFLEKKGEEILIATDNLGLWLSQDNRRGWKSIGAELPNQKINALHITGMTIYVGVYRAGIYMSEDDGVTWTSGIHDLPNQNVQSILKLGDKLLAGTDAGIFSLSEQKNTWETTSVTTQTLSLYKYDGVLVAGTSQGTLLSKDMGKSWDWIRREGTVHYTHPIGQRIIELHLNGDLIYSDDWGKTWQETIYQPRQGSYVYEIEQVGNYQVMSNNYGIHRSADQGKTWQLVYPTESMGFFDLLVDGEVLYGGTRTWDEFRKR